MMRRHEVLSNVAEAIAEVEGCGPRDLDYSLYEHVETEALITLAASDHTDWQLQFQVPGHTVEVWGIGQVLVDGTVLKRPRMASQQL